LILRRGRSATGKKCKKPPEKTHKRAKKVIRGTGILRGRKGEKEHEENEGPGRSGKKECIISNWGK